MRSSGTNSGDGALGGLGCPYPAQLHEYARGTLPEDLAETLASHLEGCPTCDSILRNIENEQQPLLVSPIANSVGEHQHDVEIAEAALRRVLTSGSPPQVDKPGNGPLPLGPFDEYELLEELAVGDMGAVYKARQVRLDKVVALKVLARGCTGDPRAVARFDREMKAAGRLSHPNIVQALDARDIGETSILVMEFVDGIDLAKLLKNAGPLKVADACELVRQAALGLQYAHEHGWVHRDIKPSNLMLSRQGCVKILDLGLALLKSESSPMVSGTGHHACLVDVPTTVPNSVLPAPGPEPLDLTATGQTMGTADYVAPEQAQDSHNVDIRADIYSLGCTLYHLLAGRAPYTCLQQHSEFFPRKPAVL
jgi:serine/threonine protein kinase